MKSMIAVVFAICLGMMLVSLALVAAPKAAPTARALLKFGNRNHHTGWYNVQSSSDSTSEERSRDRKLKAAGYETDIQSDGRKVVLVPNEQARSRLFAQIADDATRKGKSAKKAVDAYAETHEVRVSAPRKQFSAKQNGAPVVDPRFF